MDQGSKRLEQEIEIKIEDGQLIVKFVDNAYDVHFETAADKAE